MKQIGTVRPFLAGFETTARQIECRIVARPVASTPCLPVFRRAAGRQTIAVARGSAICPGGWPSAGGDKLAARGTSRHDVLSPFAGARCRRFFAAARRLVKAARGLRYNLGSCQALSLCGEELFDVRPKQ